MKQNKKHRALQCSGAVFGLRRKPYKSRFGTAEEAPVK